MYGHPIARRLEKWWKENAGRENPEEWERFLNVYFDLLRTKTDEMIAEHGNAGDDGEKVFGMSKAGGCTRESGLKLLGYKGEPFSGSSQFTFWLGHNVEVAAIATMIACGYKFDGTQTSVKITSPTTGKTLMSSAADMVTEILGVPTVVSVKSTAYKMSGRRFTRSGPTWTRRGFTELPFNGTLGTNPSHYAQLQAEMHALGFTQGLMLYASKDIVKVFEQDEYVGERGNGSLTFYAELIRYDPSVANQIIQIHDEQMEQVRNNLNPGLPRYFTSHSGFVTLPRPAFVPTDNIWGGANKEVTGTFNPCGGCALVESCKELL